MFKILHLSDFHFCIEPRRENIVGLLRRPKSQTLKHFVDNAKTGGLWRPESYDPDIADAVAMFCAENAGDIDLIVITGDLATTGMGSDLNVAKDFVSMPVTQGFFSESQRPTICHHDIPIFLLPGNHDRYRSNSADSGSRTFDLTFLKSTPTAYNSIDHVVLQDEDGGYLGLISCDHCLMASSDADKPIAMYRYGQGRVYDQHLRELELTTLDLKSKHKGLEVVWVSHFPIFYGVGKTLRLIEKEKLTQLAQRLKIEIILSGHVHSFRDENIVTVRNIGADASTSIDRRKKNMIHLLSISKWRGRLECDIENFGYSTRDGAFLPLSPRVAT